MLKFANAKINIGLHIISKRPDGYHELETIFYPVKLYDVVEIMASEKVDLSIWNSQLEVDDDNLCLRAYQLLAHDFNLKPVQIHLLKGIPIGAGLGGGSTDASATLQLLNQYFELKLSDAQLENYAARLGADCPFFVQNKPKYAQGTGTDLSPIDVDLSGYSIVIVKPDLHISTAEAYRNVTPLPAEVDLRNAIRLPIQEWKYTIRNDFEFSLFEKYPLIADIKTKMYELGAVYASMSGSGSAVFGIFESLDGLNELKHYGEVYLPVNL